MHLTCHNGLSEGMRRKVRGVSSGREKINKELWMIEKGGGGILRKTVKIFWDLKEYS